MPSRRSSVLNLFDPLYKHADTTSDDRGPDAPTTGLTAIFNRTFSRPNSVRLKKSRGGPMLGALIELESESPASQTLQGDKSPKSPPSLRRSLSASSKRTSSPISDSFPRIFTVMKKSIPNSPPDINVLSNSFTMSTHAFDASCDLLKEDASFLAQLSDCDEENSSGSGHTNFSAPLNKISAPKSLHRKSCSQSDMPQVPEQAESNSTDGPTLSHKQSIKRATSSTLRSPTASSFSTPKPKPAPSPVEKPPVLQPHSPYMRSQKAKTLQRLRLTPDPPRIQDENSKPSLHQPLNTSSERRGPGPQRVLRSVINDPQKMSPTHGMNPPQEIHKVPSLLPRKDQIKGPMISRPTRLKPTGLARPTSIASFAGQAKNEGGKGKTPVGSTSRLPAPKHKLRRVVSTSIGRV